MRVVDLRKGCIYFYLAFLGKIDIDPSYTLVLFLSSPSSIVNVICDSIYITYQWYCITSYDSFFVLPFLRSKTTI